MKYPIRLLLIIFFAIFCIGLEAASKKLPGVIRVVKIIGNVSAYNPDSGTTLNLSSGDVIKQDYTIETEEESSAVLLFSNGSTIYLDQRTKMHIQSFLQQPYSASVATLNQLKSEPSTSNTSLRLDYGKIIGSVKKLNIRDGSTYDMDSAVGIAGIRGTVFSFEIDRSFLDQVASFPSGGTFAIQEGEGFFIPKHGDKEELYLLSDLQNLNIDINTGSQMLPLSRSAAGSMTDISSESVGSFEDFSSSDFDPNTNDVDLNTAGTSTTILGRVAITRDSDDTSGDDDNEISSTILEDEFDLETTTEDTTAEESDPAPDEGQDIDDGLLNDVGIPEEASP